MLGKLNNSFQPLLPILHTITSVCEDPLQQLGGINTSGQQ